jgi:hypothetical protein
MQCPKCGGELEKGLAVFRKPWWLLTTLVVRTTCCFRRADGREKQLFSTHQKPPGWLCNQCGTLIVERPSA